MEKFGTLQPVKLHGPSETKPTGTPAKPAPVQFIGRLPIDLHLLVLVYLPVTDFPAYARCSHALLNLSKHDRVWQSKWNAFRFDKFPHLAKVLDQLEDGNKLKEGGIMKDRPPTIPVESVDDEFGDFAQVQASASQGEFVGKSTLFAAVSSMSTPTYMALYMRTHKLLKPFVPALLSPPHAILTTLFPSLPGTEPIPQLVQSRTLHLLSLWLSPWIRPLRNWKILHASLRAGVDRYEASLLSAFDVADSRSDENGMREAAEASWEVWDGEGEWEMGRTWAEKREIFYEAGRWKPMDNFTCVFCPRYIPELTLLQREFDFGVRCDGRVHQSCS